MVLDHTNQIFARLGQPGGFLRARGLGAVGTPMTTTAPETSFFGLTMADIQGIVSGLNSQQLFQLNLQRAEQGLPPLNPAMYAPSMNFGMTPETRQLVMFGAIGLIAVLLLKRR